MYAMCIRSKQELGENKEKDFFVMIKGKIIFRKREILDIFIN